MQPRVPPKKTRREPPQKPRKDFPLWPHRSGSWCAVIDGNRRAFGGWAKDLKGEAALVEYNRYRENRAKGMVPMLADETVTMGDVINSYLTRQHRRATDGEITLKNYGDGVRALSHLAASVGPGVRVTELRPGTFRDYRVTLKKYSRSTIARSIAHIKAAFKWAFNEELVIAPPRYGADFRPPPKTPMRAKLFTSNEVRAMLKTATLPLRAMIRLGIECGFGNTDCATLRWEEIDLSSRIISLIEGRHKTGAKRRCAVSAALVADLRKWRDKQVKRKIMIVDPSLTFSTLNGLAYVREEPRERPTLPPNVVDSVAVAFGKLRREKLRWPSDGRSFYTLRRTHRTWTDEVNDHHAAALVMGHETGSVASIYVQKVEDSRLFKLNEHVLGRIKRTEASKAAQPSDGDAQAENVAGARRIVRGRSGKFSKSSGRSIH